MKILLINPDTTQKDGRDLYTGDILAAMSAMDPYKKMFTGFPLALTTLAAVTPKEHTVKIIDEFMTPINFDEDCDLVGLTAMTFKAERAYEIAKEFRVRGKTVILGGIHASMRTEEAGGYVDCVVQGEAEEIWAGVLKDFEGGVLKKVYKALNPPDITKLPPPRYDLIELGRYFFVYLQTSRGCPHDCDFCTVTMMNGRKMRLKEPQQIVKEIDDVLEAISHSPIKVRDRIDDKIKNFYTSFFFTDDNFAINREHAIAVCKEIIKYQRENDLVFTWTTQVNFRAGLDDELCETFYESGCQALFMGFESLDLKALKAMNKTMNSPELYSKAIQNVRQHGMECVFSTIIGGDFDTPQTVDALAHFIDENQIFYVLPNILTPYPGTRLYKTMTQEGRIFDAGTNHYNIRNVVFRPKLMAPFELQKAYTELCEHIFAMRARIVRSKGCLDSAHKKNRFSVCMPLRLLAYFCFLYSFAVLWFRKRLSWLSLPTIIWNFSLRFLRWGTFMDFIFLAWIMDNDAFAQSERERLATAKVRFNAFGV